MGSLDCLDPKPGWEFNMPSLTLLKLAGGSTLILILTGWSVLVSILALGQGRQGK